MAKLEQQGLQPPHARLLSALTLARIAVAELGLKGFTVLDVRLDSGNATIVVRPSQHTQALCGQLVQGRFRAPFAGCTVEWSAEGRWPWPAGRGH